MSKLIFDILPPKYHQPAKIFWQQNSGRIKIATLLTFVLAFTVLSVVFYTNVLRSQTNDAQAAPAFTQVNVKIESDNGGAGYGGTNITTHYTIKIGERVN